MLNKWQKAAYEAYDDDGLLALGDNPTPKDCENCGDTLFSFIISELDEKEDCGSWEEALKRMNKAQSQVQGVITTLINRMNSEP